MPVFSGKLCRAQLSHLLWKDVLERPLTVRMIKWPSTIALRATSTLKRSIDSLPVRSHAPSARLFCGRLTKMRGENERQFQNVESCRMDTEVTRTSLTTDISSRRRESVRTSITMPTLWLGCRQDLHLADDLTSPVPQAVVEFSKHRLRDFQLDTLRLQDYRTTNQ